MPQKNRKAVRAAQEKGEKPSLNKRLLAFSVVLAVIIIFGAVLYQLLHSSGSEEKFPLKAAIIDQLSEDFYNQTFVDEVTKILNEHYFSVEYYGHRETTVAFFRGLAKANYGIIILRLHSALREGKPIVDFFTSEPYSPNKYVKEQEEGLLVNGTVIYSGKHYFAFTPKFVERLEGRFSKSIVVAMGCQSLNQTAGIPMAKAFCDKGAAAYIGWSSWVSMGHSDTEIAKLMRRLMCENKTIHEAVSSAYRDPLHSAGLAYYPNTAKNLRLSDLIEEVQNSGTTPREAAFNVFHAWGLWSWIGVSTLLPLRHAVVSGDHRLLGSPSSVFQFPRRGQNLLRPRLSISRSLCGRGETPTILCRLPLFFP